jgi:hypothetical protein
VSIKEKAPEIKAQDQTVTEGFFALEEPAPQGVSRVASIALGAVLIIASGVSYGLGYYAGKGGQSIEPIPMTYTEQSAAVVAHESAETRNELRVASSTRVESAPSPSAVATDASPKGTYVGSRKGTKYHLPWCSGAKAISEENKIWFSSKEEAQSQGYSPAANCKGI